MTAELFCARAATVETAPGESEYGDDGDDGDATAAAIGTPWPPAVG